MGNETSVDQSKRACCAVNANQNLPNTKNEENKKEIIINTKECKECNQRKKYYEHNEHKKPKLQRISC
jgi:hypothetical protein